MEEKKAVKVLAVVCQMNRGGLESRLMDIIRQLDYTKVCMDVYTYREDKGVFDDEIIRAGGTVYYNPPLHAGNMLWYVHYFKGFLLRHPEYRIVHAHQDAWCSVFCKGASLAGVPVRIAHSRTAISAHTFKDFIKNLIKLSAKYNATHYFAVSVLAGEWLFGKRYMKSGKVQIWKNAITCSRYRFNPQKRKEMRRQLMIKENERVIIHVGNFRQGKNQMFLPDILREVLRKEQARLICVGAPSEPAYFNKVVKKVTDMGLEGRVDFLGKRDDVEELLQAADVLCCPSFFEGMPGSVLEAQASGLPCIISSSVTKECMILRTTKALNLNQPVGVWADAVIDGFQERRIDTYEEMVKAGFDIDTLVDDLTRFYLYVGEMKCYTKN